MDHSIHNICFWVVNAASKSLRDIPTETTLLGPVPELKALVNSSLVTAQYCCDILQQHALCAQYKPVPHLDASQAVAQQTTRHNMSYHI